MVDRSWVECARYGKETYLYPNVQIYTDMFRVDRNRRRLVDRHNLMRLDIVLRARRYLEYVVMRHLRRLLFSCIPVSCLYSSTLPRPYSRVLCRAKPGKK